MKLRIKIAFVIAFICSLSSISGQGFREIKHDSTKSIFGISAGADYSTPTFIDIDGDQDLDLFIGQENGLISFSENIGSPTEPNYAAPILSPFGLKDNLDRSSPAFVDIDDDGDYDLLVGTIGTLVIKFFFYTNTGTKFSPNFVRSDDIEPFDLTFGSNFFKPTFGDLDNDGDFDILLGHNFGLAYTENTGTPTSPIFGEATTTVFGLQPFATTVEMSPQLFDFDSDGDLDIITGQKSGNIKLYYNLGSFETPLFLEIGSKLLLDYTAVGSAPALGDIDNDGDVDMLVGYQTGSRNLRWHMGTDAPPSYALDADNTPLNIENVGINAKPEFIDEDYDGDLDIIIGRQSGVLSLQKNIGTHQAALFDTVQLNPYGLFDIGEDASPAFVDFNNDRIPDLVIGTKSGKFWQFENVGTPLLPEFTNLLVSPTGNNGLKTLENYSNPSFAALDDVGRYDLFAGEFTGNIKCFKNIGSNMAPLYDSLPDNPFGITDIGLLSTPEFVDIDNDLDYDLVVGGAGGRIHYFENTGSPLTPVFAPKVINPFGLDTITTLQRFQSHPAAGDIDNDGDVDLLVGNSLGETRLFENKPCKPAYPLYNISAQQKLYQSKEVISSTARIAKVHDITFIGTEGLKMIAGFEVAEGATFQGIAGECINN